MIGGPDESRNEQYKGMIRVARFLQANTTQRALQQLRFQPQFPSLRSVAWPATPDSSIRPHTLPSSSRSISDIMADRPTLVKPPPVDPSKSAIENVLELIELSAIGPVRLPFKSRSSTL